MGASLLALAKSIYYQMLYGNRMSYFDLNPDDCFAKNTICCYSQIRPRLCDSIFHMEEIRCGWSCFTEYYYNLMVIHKFSVIGGCFILMCKLINMPSFYGYSLDSSFINGNYWFMLQLIVCGEDFQTHGIFFILLKGKALDSQFPFIPTFWVLFNGGVNYIFIVCMIIAWCWIQITNAV